MDDAAIPGTSAHSDLRKGFQNEDVTPAHREGTGNRAPYNAASDDYDVGLVHDLQFNRAGIRLLLTFRQEGSTDETPKRYEMTEANDEPRIVHS